MRPFTAWSVRSLRTRLMCTFLAVVCLGSLVNAFAVVQLGRVNATTATVTRRALPSVRALGSIGFATARLRMATLQYVSAGTVDRGPALDAMDRALAKIEHE